MGTIAIYMALSLTISALCSLLEAVLLSTPLSFIVSLEAQNKKGWELLKNIKLNIDRPISAILTINTIANTVGASLVGSQAAQIFDSVGIGIVSGVFTVLILFFSEILPKTIASYYWRNLAIPASKIIQIYVFITYPLVLLIEKFTKNISKKNAPVTVSREDVAAIVTTGAEEGVLEKEENKMIQSLLRLDKITAHEIMTPSVVVTMADSGMTLKEFYDSEDFGKFSRIPIYDDDKDDFITGYVLKQEILEEITDNHSDKKLKELSRPILSFPENETVSNIWEKLLEKKEHISIIIDEYGSLRGIVTMEDVIESMLGFEIMDEKDEVADMQELAKEQWEEIQKKNEQQLNATEKQ